MKLFFEKSVEKIQVSLKSDKNYGCFTWRPVYIVWQYCLFATTVSQLKIYDFSGETLKVLKCYNFLWVQRRHNCSPAASFANCIMTLYLLKVYLKTFLSTPVTQKCQILSCDTLVANERYMSHFFWEWVMFETKDVEKIRKHFTFNNSFFSKIVPFMR
jgi:hypothetical protein